MTSSEARKANLAKPPDRDGEGDEVPGSGVPLVLALLDSELKAEDARKDSIEKRGLAVVTTSGTLVTALFALAAVVTDQDQYKPPAAVLIVILVALAFFVAAAVEGLRVNDVRLYQRINVWALRQTVKEDLSTLTAAEARRRTADSNSDVLVASQRTTDSKAARLKRAITFEVAAVANLALAVALLIVISLF